MPMASRNFTHYILGSFRASVCFCLCPYLIWVLCTFNGMVANAFSLVSQSVRHGSSQLFRILEKLKFMYVQYTLHMCVYVCVWYAWSE